MADGIVPTLLDIERSVADWLAGAVPNTDEEQVAWARVLDSQNQLHAAIGQIALDDIVLAGKDLAGEAKDLDSLSQEITNTAKDIKTAAQVLNIVGQAVTLAIAIAGMI
jgi:hypothetical protein